RAHAVGQRPHPLIAPIAEERCAHLRGVPITSAPAGGVKLTSAGATGALRSIFPKLMVVVSPSLSSRIMRLSSAPAKPNSALRKSASASRGSTSTHSSPARVPAGVRLKLLRTSVTADSSMAGVADRTRPQARAPYRRRTRPTRLAIDAAGPTKSSFLRRRRRQHVASAVGLQRTDQPRLLHRLEQPRGAVVADLQPPLHIRDGGF